MTSGVNITGSSGQPGANASIRIRGMGSFNASNEPLFVIDGVPVTSGNLSTGSGSEASYMNNAKTNIMSTINPSDIENITGYQGCRRRLPTVPVRPTVLS